MARICDICGGKAAMIVNIGTSQGTRQVEICQNHLDDWFQKKDGDAILCEANRERLDAQRKMQPLQDKVMTREWELAKNWLKSHGL